VARERDWVIVLECFHNRVQIHGGGAFSQDQLSEGSNPFGVAVYEMIRARQKRQPDVLPILKLQVHRDAVPTYYAALRCVSPMRLPTSVENLPD
jgi:hypothetical protein